MQAIVICTKNAKCLPVLIASIGFYVPEDVVVYISGSNIKVPGHKTINLKNNGTNFGDSYNEAMSAAFENHEEVVIANDDIVLTPYSWATLEKDVRLLQKKIKDVGYVAARSDFARGVQNIRCGEGTLKFLRFESENSIVEQEIIAPIFAYIHRDNWINFPSVNWFSDDIQCLDMAQLGLRHFVSVSYVHHVGSQTCGTDVKKCINDAKTWIALHRPDMFNNFFGENHEEEKATR